MEHEENFPLFSIITPSFNRADLIAEALDSVLAQDYPAIEHLVIDGGSTDGTLDILARYPNLRLVSEPDEGVYDALNKGVRLAKGAIIGFLNTDDAYAPDVFRQVASIFREHPGAQAVNGTARVFSETAGKRSTIVEYPCIPGKELPVRATVGVPAINSWFFRTEVFAQLGGFDTSYKISADRHFILRFLCANLPYQNIFQTVYLYRQHDASMTITGRDVYYEKFVFEHFRMAESFIADSNTSAELKKACRIWHSRDTAAMAIQQCRKSLRKAIEYSTLGMRFDHGWPFHLGHQLARSLKRSLFKK